MKKIQTIMIVSMLLLISLGTLATAVKVKNTQASDYTIRDNREDDVRAFKLFGGPLVNKLFNQIDIISFSIYEDPNTPQFLFMNMSIGEIKYTELRSLYNIVWEYNGLQYFTGMHTLNSSKTILNYSGYFDADGVEHKIWNTSLKIDESNSVFYWTITKNDLGLKAGDTLKKPYAHSGFGTKDWETIKIIATDKIQPGPDYIIQY
jgi:hypothetical protein